MSIKQFLFFLSIAEVIALSACVSADPAEPIAESDTAASSAVKNYKGFVWSAENGLQLIPQPSYAENIVIKAINNHGQVVGHLKLRDGRDDFRAFIWSARDGLQRLGSLVGPEGESTALVINDDGEVRGLSDGPSTRNGPEGRELHDAFVWTADAGMKSTNWTRFGDLKPVSEGGKLRMPPGADCMHVTNASSSGLAVGSAGLIQSGGACAGTTTLMWDLDGTPIVIEQCAGCDMGVADINNRGQVIGDHDGYGFRWTLSGGFVRLPTLHAFLLAINENGDAAGVLFDDVGSSTKPIVWMKSGQIRTIELPAGATSGSAVDINNRGQVTGTFR